MRVPVSLVALLFWTSAVYAADWGDVSLRGGWISSLDRYEAAGRSPEAAPVRRPHVALPSAAMGVLPGFRIETIWRGNRGFATSLVTDSTGTIYFTTTEGRIHRLDRDGVVPVALLPTKTGGNGGLLGMALLDDRTAVVHYTTWDNGVDDFAKVLDDVISRVDLVSGEETLLHTFVCDVDFRERGVSSEHHGGNPTVGPDGSVFVGIGEYGGPTVSQKEGWNGGRIWRIAPDGSVTEWARGLRNPYDLAWDPELGRIVVADNGPKGGDEIHVIDPGDNLGWPLTFGFEAPVDGMVPPDYVFPMTVAPTGLARLDGANPLLRRGYLLGGFVTRALYYFPRIARGDVQPPVAIIDQFPEFVIDVTQAATGEIYMVTSTFPDVVSIHRLHTPPRGDCNGDGLVNALDLLALADELRDAESQPMIEAHQGSHAGSWGCDANADGLVNGADYDAIRALIQTRRRAVGAR